MAIQVDILNLLNLPSVARMVALCNKHHIYVDCLL